MITLLASIAGFISSIIPELMRYFVDKNDKKHELEILAYQIKLKKLSSDTHLDEINLNRDINGLGAIYKTYKTGIYWVDSLNGTVRPVLAYAFFFIYGYIKYLQFRVCAQNINIAELMTLLWSLEDQAIFASIISFYFGQRAVNQIRRR